jgi:hypothetical protein
VGGQTPKAKSMSASDEEASDGSCEGEELVIITIYPWLSVGPSQQNMNKFHVLKLETRVLT